ncbi:MULTISPECIES: glycosyltransferase family A protein [unclassified Bradyrhizobium]|uniref:glycosyltransferase family 2 protein n=1 Tax=unclassified Bradyrhizobium TaxID=2631580 RepID=UPI0033992C4A
MRSFSVILPVRNGWPYVRQCVESILAQTYPDFELIVLDNQSTDNTVPWLKSLADSRIQLHYSPSALSIVDSWARATAVEKQEYMTLIGHDDALDPDFLLTINREIDRYPDAKLYQTGFRLIDSVGKTIRGCRPVPERESPAQYLQGRLTYQRDITGTGVVMRSAEYDRIGGIPHFERLFFADDALWLSLMRGGYKAFDAAELCSVRMHARKESTTQPSSWPSLLLGLNQFADFVEDYVRSDAAARAIVVQNFPDFMQRYHNNLYILALLEACQKGRRIDPETANRLFASLEQRAPAATASIRRSLTIRLIEALNASPMRKMALPFWEMYRRFWMHAQ